MDEGRFEEGLDLARNALAAAQLSEGQQCDKFELDALDYLIGSLFETDGIEEVHFICKHLIIYKLGFNQNYYTFTLILLLKIILCSKFPLTELINHKCFEMRFSFTSLQHLPPLPWKREFKLPWREAGPPNHHDDKVDSDQQVVDKELSLNSLSL